MYTPCSQIYIYYKTNYNFEYHSNLTVTDKRTSKYQKGGINIHFYEYSLFRNVLSGVDSVSVVNIEHEPLLLSFHCSSFQAFWTHLQWFLLNEMRYIYNSMW